MAKILIEWRRGGQTYGSQVLSTVGVAQSSAAAPDMGGMGGEALVRVLTGSVYVRTGVGVSATAQNGTFLTEDDEHVFPASVGDIVSALDAALAEATYQLASNVGIASGGSTTAVAGVQGGSYVWALTAGAFNGATIKLQALGPDGSTYVDVDSLTANGQKGVVLGENAQVRLAATGGAPTGVSASLT